MNSIRCPFFGTLGQSSGPFLGPRTFDILHGSNVVDSYGAMSVSHGRFRGFLTHGSASLRCISTGFTLGLSGPRSIFRTGRIYDKTTRNAGLISSASSA